MTVQTHAMEHDWKAETRGLGYMILQIANDYRAVSLAPPPTLSKRDAKKFRKAQATCRALLDLDSAPLGGDSEFLRHHVLSAQAYVEGPLAERLGPR